jgi:hypothetical protein
MLTSTDPKCRRQYGYRKEDGDKDRDRKRKREK